MTPEAVVACCAKFHGAWRRDLRLGGTIEKILGDEISRVFGLPRQPTRCAEHAALRRPCIAGVSSDLWNKARTNASERPRRHRHRASLRATRGLGDVGSRAQPRFTVIRRHGECRQRLQSLTRELRRVVVRRDREAARRRGAALRLQDMGEPRAARAAAGIRI